MQIGSYGGSGLPPLTDSSPCNNTTKTEQTYVPCFSNQTETRGTLLNYFSNNPALSSIPLYLPQSLHVSDPVLTQEQSVSQAMFENNRRQSFKTLSISQDTGVSNTDIEFGRRGLDHQEVPSSSTGPVDLEPFWSY